MLDAIRAYLAAALNDPPELSRLAAALDGLAVAYHGTPPGSVTHPDVDAPRANHATVAKQVAARFPELGLYPLLDPLEDGQELLFGDAISDIEEIACDLMEVLWEFEHTSEAQACWTFRFGYETHWGAHLHDLRRVLWSTMFVGGPSALPGERPPGAVDKGGRGPADPW